MAYDWSKEKVLVTGAGGFIGSHLSEELVRLGAKVRAFVRYNSAGSRGWLDTGGATDALEVTQGDIAHWPGVRRAIEGIDVVFHLAALIGIPYSYEAPLSYVRTNIEGTFNVLDAALRAGVKKVVHTSTSEVYGSARYVPMDENHPLQAQSPYSASKIAADKLAESFYLSYGLPVTTVRPFNSYGPRQSTRAVIPALITQILSGSEDLPVRAGNTSTTRDYTYVRDTVRGFILAAQTDDATGRALNLGSGRETNTGNLARTVVQLMGSSREIAPDAARLRPRTSEVQRLVADSSLAAKLLDWRAEVPLEEGIRLTVEWFRQNRHRYRPDVYAI